jgi:hypothetical protein
MSDTKPAPRPPDIGRRTLTPFGYGVTIVVPLVLVALAFVALHFHYDKEQLVTGTRLPILTSDWKPGNASQTALATGQLVLDHGCLRLQSKDQGVVDLVWPADYEASVRHVGGGDQLLVYDPDRDVVARGGQTLELGGGFTPDVAAYADEKCAPQSGQAFLVQSRPKVVGVGS